MILRGRVFRHVAESAKGFRLVYASRPGRGDVCPEVRLGQLIANLSFLARELSNESIWEVEDTELLEAARKHLQEWRSRRGAVA